MKLLYATYLLQIFDAKYWLTWIFPQIIFGSEETRALYFGRAKILPPSTRPFRGKACHSLDIVDKAKRRSEVFVPPVVGEGKLQ